MSNYSENSPVGPAEDSSVNPPEASQSVADQFGTEGSTISYPEAPPTLGVSGSDGPLSPLPNQAGPEATLGSPLDPPVTSGPPVSSYDTPLGTDPAAASNPPSSEGDGPLSSPYAPGSAPSPALGSPVPPGVSASPSAPSAAAYLTPPAAGTMPRNHPPYPGGGAPSQNYPPYPGNATPPRQYLTGPARPPVIAPKPGMVSVKPFLFTDYLTLPFKVVFGNLGLSLLVGLCLSVTALVLALLVFLIFDGESVMQFATQDGVMTPSLSFFQALGLGILAALFSPIWTVAYAFFAPAAVAQASGKKASISQSWTVVAPRLWELVKLGLLWSPLSLVMVTLWGVLPTGVDLLPILIGGAFSLVVIARLLPTVPLIVLDGVDFISALRISFQICRNSMWKILGGVFLFQMVVAIVMQVVEIVLALVAATLVVSMVLSGSSPTQASVLVFLMLIILVPAIMLMIFILPFPALAYLDVAFESEYGRQVVLNRANRGEAAASGTCFEPGLLLHLAALPITVGSTTLIGGRPSHPHP